MYTIRVQVNKTVYLYTGNKLANNFVYTEISYDKNNLLLTRVNYEHFVYGFHV